MESLVCLITRIMTQPCCANLPDRPGSFLYSLKEPLPLKSSLKILKDLASVLEDMHSRKQPLLHRDVKAPNVLRKRMSHLNPLASFEGALFLSLSLSLFFFPLLFFCAHQLVLRLLSSSTQCRAAIPTQKQWRNCVTLAALRLSTRLATLSLQITLDGTVPKCCRKGDTPVLATRTRLESLLLKY